MTAEVATYQANLASDRAYAELLARSDLLPRQYREKPANVLYAIGWGQMLGIHPMAAITGVNIIDGKPSSSAALISALVRRAGHRLRTWVEYDDATGFPIGNAEIVRRDDPDFKFQSQWTVERAERANLLKVKDGKVVARSKDGNPLAWEKFTEALVVARATTEVARQACEEALSGMHYSAEELGADVDEEGNAVVPSTAVDIPVEDAVIVPDEPATPAERTGTPRTKDDIYSVSGLTGRILAADNGADLLALFLEAEQRDVLDEPTHDGRTDVTVRALLARRDLEMRDKADEGEK